MSDAVFESPVSRPPVRSQGAITLLDVSVEVKWLVRAAPDSPVASALGVPFGRARRVGAGLVCGSRPDEWLVIGEAENLLAGLDRSGHVSIVDLTHGRAMFRLTGEQSPSALEKVCSLDWADPMTPDGAVTSASVARVTCDLVRDDVDGVRSYLVLCDRSYGQYLFDALADASAEFD